MLEGAHNITSLSLVCREHLARTVGAFGANHTIAAEKYAAPRRARLGAISAAQIVPFGGAEREPWPLPVRR